MYDAAQIVGRVVDRAGRPIAGTGVSVSVLERAREVSHFDPDLVLDGGRFGRVLQPLDFRAVSTRTDGSYEVTVPTPLAETPAFVSAWLDGRRVETGFAMITPQSRNVVDLRVEASFTVAGTVLQPDGRPCAGAHVEVQHLTEIEVGNLDEQLRQLPPRAVSDEQGRFTIEMSRAGGHRVVSCASGLAASRPVRFDLGSAHQRHEVTLHLEAPAILEGVLRDAAGRPLPGIDVGAYESDGQSADRGCIKQPALRVGENARVAGVSCRTAEDGSFALGPLSAARVYDVGWIDAADPTDSSERTWLRHVAVTASRVAITATATHGGGAAELAVRTTSGEALHAFDVQLLRASPWGWQPQRSATGLERLADGVRWSGLSPGVEYRALIHAPGYPACSTTAFATRGDMWREVVELSRGGRLRIRTVGRFGQPRVGVRLLITAVDPDQEPSRVFGQTGRDGSFETGLLRHGEYRVAALTRFADGPCDTTVIADQTVGVDLLLH